MSAPRLTRIIRVVIAALVAAIALVVPSTSAQARAVPCVGLVVNLPDGKVIKECVSYEEGLTGQQVLENAGLKLGFAKNGLVCQVSGQPDTCGDGSDGSYWSYYHRKPGAAPDAWAFSTKGPQDYVVHDEETEGWVFVQAPAPKKTPMPDNVPYDELFRMANAPPGGAAPPDAQPSSQPATSTTDADATDTAADDDDSDQSIGIWIGIGIAILIATGVGTGAAKRRAKE